ncbi:MAG: hypothetical protein FWE20_01560 [Defluviitaleaceae bacterium]|nr:hypothetical protein [Defluviitaleaceae bacterium]
MSSDMDKMLRAIYINAELIGDYDLFKRHLRGVMGEENVAIAIKEIRDYMEEKGRKKREEDHG